MDVAAVIDDVLQHYGVKGMHWGVRRKATVDAREVVVRDTRRKVKTSGGKGLPAHPDAVRARTIGQRGRGSGLKALSDKELTDYAKRLQLEQNVKRLNFNDQSPPKKFVLTLLGQTGKNNIQNATNDVVSNQVKKYIKTG